MAGKQSAGAKFEMDARGNFRIGVAGAWSDWTHYPGIAQLRTPTGEVYIAVSDYFHSEDDAGKVLLHRETVYKLEELPTQAAGNLPVRSHERKKVKHGHRS